MRILNIIQRYPPAIGGAEIWCQEVCREWVRQGHDVSVLTFDVNEEEDFWRDPPMDRNRLALGPLDIDEGVRVRRFRRSLPPYTLYHGVYKLLLDRLLRVYFYGPHSLEMVTKLLGHVRAADAVFLHTTPYPHNLLGWAAARWLGKRVLIAPHFHPGHSFYDRWHQYALLRRCDGVTTLSEFENRVLEERGVAPERLVAAGCGVPEQAAPPEDVQSRVLQFREEHGVEEGTKIVAFLGRKLKDKGVAHLYEACEEVAQGRDVALFLAGPGSDWFQEWRAELAPGRTRLVDLGRVSDETKDTLLRAADLLALPSRYEAFGIVFLEAWAAGTPVVGSDGGAVPSVLGEGGLTAPFGDAAALATRIEQVLDEPGLSEALVAAGQELIRERYNWPRVAELCSRKISEARRDLRVLVVSNFYAPHVLGGAEIVAQRHAQAIAERGHSVRVFAGRLDESLPRYSRRRERTEGIEVERVCLHRADIGADRRNHDHPEIDVLFRETLLRDRPDVVHVHNLSGLSLGVLRLCREFSIPTVVTLHDYWAICAKNTMTRNDGAICLSNGDVCSGCFSHVGVDHRIPIQQRNAEIHAEFSQISRLIAPSRYLASRYSDNGFEDRRIEIVPYGIELERYQRRRRSWLGPCRIGYHGYIGPHKGIDVLLEAMTKVSGATLTLRGPCDDKNGYVNRIRELGLEGVVTIEPPFTNDKAAKLLSSIDFTVLPSIWPDNHPVSIAEAMASALPVVSTTLGGIPEMIRDGETGFLVPPGQPEALAERIQLLVDDPSLREALGARARDVAHEEYATVLAMDRLEEVYRSAVAAPVPSSPLEPNRSGGRNERN